MVVLGAILLFLTDPTLTITNLTEVLAHLGEGEESRFTVYIGISRPAFSEITLHQTPLNEAYWEWYLKNHPAPSWRNIAEALYRFGDHTVLEVLRIKIPYIRGIATLASCD